MLTKTQRKALALILARWPVLASQACDLEQEVSDLAPGVVSADEIALTWHAMTLAVMDYASAA